MTILTHRPVCTKCWCRCTAGTSWRLTTAPVSTPGSGSAAPTPRSCPPSGSSRSVATYQSLTELIFHSPGRPNRGNWHGWRPLAGQVSSDWLMRDNDDWLLTSYWPGTSSPESQKNSESSSASTPSPCRWTQYLFYILFVTRKHKPRETGTEPGPTPTSPPSPWGSPGAWRPSRRPLTGISSSMSLQLVLTFTRRLSKHHIRHIKAYDPNEGKVRWIFFYNWIF